MCQLTWFAASRSPLSLAIGKRPHAFAAELFRAIISQTSRKPISS
jgi:hypothetical protein